MKGPNLKGAIAEAEIAAAAIKLGIPVYSPIAEHGRSDLILELGSRLLRVQCKWGRLDRDRAVINVALQTSRFTPAGYVRTSYTAEEIDAVAIYCGELDRCYVLPADLVVNRAGISLRLSPPGNWQRACINLASEFEFAGAVAQLEERRYGIPEAGGSSPPSSTSRDGESGPRQVVGAHQFRNHFGYYMERAAAGEEVAVTRRGKPFVRLMPASGQLPLAA
jgi:prevent-host-death family protein